MSSGANMSSSVIESYEGAYSPKITALDAINIPREPQPRSTRVKTAPQGKMRRNYGAKAN